MFYIGYTLIFIGLAFSLISVIGCIKMPDAYTKLHAAGVADICGIPIALTGIMVTQGLTITTAKIFLVIVLIFLINPLSTHALIRAASYRDNILHKEKK